MSKSEALIQQEGQLFFASIGVSWRNNVGACVDNTGRMVRYGLANDSKQMNQRIKSSDDIGMTPTLIMPHHVGKVLGVFTALEWKAEDWKFRPSDDHSVAQLRYHDIVRAHGGFAGFAQSNEDVLRIIGRG